MGNAPTPGSDVFYDTPAIIYYIEGTLFWIDSFAGRPTATFTPPPLITSSTTATAMVGQAFSYTITANNTPTSFNATGLPAGLLVNTVTGVISGTPTTLGITTITLSAIKEGGKGNQSLTLTVNSPPKLTIRYDIAANGFALHFQGNKTDENVIEYSTDFKTWTPLGTKGVGETDLYVENPPEVNTPYRFYRVIKP